MSNFLRSTSYTPLSPELEAVTEGMVGFGISGESTDYLTPQMKVMQSGSPDLDSIPGCEPGDIVIVNTPLPPFKGESGVIVQHCGQIDTFSEFLPGRQGFVERHLKLPADIESRPATNGSKRPILIRKSSQNLVTETREVYLIASGVPCVLYASGTQHQFARKWMTFMAQQKRSDGRVAATFSRCYLLRTESRSNALGRWFGLTFEDAGPAPVEQIPAALEFYRFAQTGALRLSAPDAA
jgi:hypothetical protein